MAKGSMLGLLFIAAVGCQKTEPFVQKGIKAGKIPLVYMQEEDPGQCSVVTDYAEPSKRFWKDPETLATKHKRKRVDACPTDHVVGTCDENYGVLTNYSGPKWTAETGKKDCESKGTQHWIP